jgi:hypothetical protein
MKFKIEIIITIIKIIFFIEYFNLNPSEILLEYFH